jgi:hypothetical protein
MASFEWPCPGQNMKVRSRSLHGMVVDRVACGAAGTHVDDELTVIDLSLLSHRWHACDFIH